MEDLIRAINGVNPELGEKLLDENGDLSTLNSHLCARAQCRVVGRVGHRDRGHRRRVYCPTDGRGLAVMRVEFELCNLPRFRAMEYLEQGASLAMPRRYVEQAQISNEGMV